MDGWLAVAGFGVGLVVGLTGMGGGALMTPLLVLFFGIQPLAAVSSDLVASAVMKPVGSLVHLRRGTVDLQLVKWLCLGSIPTAFAGVFLLRLLGDGERVQAVVRTGLGLALLVAAGAIVVKAYLGLRARSRAAASGVDEDPDDGSRAVRVRILPTLAVGAVGGLIVGMTSVGSGSLIIICLMALYPRLAASRLVGTDLVQAVPLVASAALAHVFFGDFQLGLTTSLLLGCLPGVFLGAHLSSRAPAGMIRSALAFVLLASGLKLLGVGTVALGWSLAGIAVLAPVLWAAVRRRHRAPAAELSEEAATPELRVGP